MASASLAASTATGLNSRGVAVMYSRFAAGMMALSCTRANALSSPATLATPAVRVRLVAHHEFEGVAGSGLHVGHDLDRLVGREHRPSSDRRRDVHAASVRAAASVVAAQLGHVESRFRLQSVLPAVGRSRQRTGGWVRCIPPSLLERLSDQGNRRCEEEHRLPSAGVLLSDAQRCEGLAGAARHDQLAAVAFLEADPNVVDGLGLV